MGALVAYTAAYLAASSPATRPECRQKLMQQLPVASAATPNHPLHARPPA